MLLLGEKKEYDIIITEIGGVGDNIESSFIEAVRQLQWECPKRIVSLFTPLS